MILALGFLNPLLLWGLPLAAVPVVIHLLNKRRYDTRRWAAMEFLLRAMKRNRKKLRMEQWLVLLLRTLAVLLLVLLVSRPELESGVLGTSVRHHVVLLDDSASMAQRGGADDSFSRACAAIEQLATELARSRSGDHFTLITASAPDRPLLAGVPVGADLPSRVDKELAACRIGDGDLAPARLLAAASARADEDKASGEVEFHVVTDLRRRDWVTADGRADAAVAKWLEGLDPDTHHVTLIAVGAPDAENLAVSDVRCTDRLCIAGVPVHVEIDVTNRGDAVSAPTELMLGVDAKSRIVRPVPPIQPGESTSVDLTQTFQEPGTHGIDAHLSPDRYATDDVRSLALEVRPASRVLLVDGDPRDELDQSETYFTTVALQPGGETVTGIDVRVVADQELASVKDEELADTDQIWLCNVSSPDDDTVARLERFAAAGGGLVITCGDRIDLDRYARALWKDGHGLLPAPLTGVQGEPDDRPHVYLAAPDDPLFQRNTEEQRFMFAEFVQVERWIDQRVTPEDPARVLLRVKDADGPPLLTSRPYDKDGGLVFLLGTTVDIAWTDLPKWPEFPLLCHELHAAGAKPQDFTRYTFGPDGAFRFTLDPGVHRPDVQVRTPEGDVIRTLAAASQSGEKVTVELPMHDLPGQYGLLEVARTRHGGGEDVTWIARNPLLEEGRLQPLTAAAFRATYPAEVQDRVTVQERNGPVSLGEIAGGGSLWRQLGLVMLAAMLLETVLAWRFGRR